MAIRREALTDVFREIYDREPAITSADMLLEFAKRNPIARHHRVSRKDAAEFLRPEGRAQVYKRVPVEVRMAWANFQADRDRRTLRLGSVGR